VLESVPIERVQAFWDDRPCNVRHSPEPVGTRRYFDEVEARKYFVEPHIPLFADFPRWAGKHVLEIGCGIGTDTINFARVGARVTALDLSSKSIEIARERAKVFDLDERIDFIQCSAEDLSPIWSRGPFDLIYSFGVLHHTPHPFRALEQIRKLSNPSTTFKLMMYHERSWKVGVILLEHSVDLLLHRATPSELVSRYSEAQTGCPVTYAYTRESLRTLLEETGFDVEEMFVDHIFPYRVSDYRNYEYKRTASFRWMPHSLFRWLETHYGWHLCATARPAHPAGHGSEMRGVK
jgi:2-polyprenyl-3-methyl-5-hydroxy-6-metoxy-1,4-benzoquinol methylase